MACSCIGDRVALRDQLLMSTLNTEVAQIHLSKPVYTFHPICWILSAVYFRRTTSFRVSEIQSYKQVNDH